MATVGGGSDNFERRAAPVDNWTVEAATINSLSHPTGAPRYSTSTVGEHAFDGIIDTPSTR
ncbi:hypothetical protein [Frankia sp. CiP1_Cm_nod1]|uniref:hypothetical protein n=1 Tax=Frankia sp. CiP1_Cm_nod1 TaxID=2897160 RepID=UPI002024F5E7